MPRRQNPQMHLFESMAAAFDATDDPAFQNPAPANPSFFLANLLRQAEAGTGRIFRGRLVAHRARQRRARHQAECLWLLKGFERITDCPTDKFRSKLLASALRYREESTACLIDESDAVSNIKWQSRRPWPQTKGAKAWVAQAEARGGCCRRSPRGAVVPRTALSEASGRWGLVRPVRSRRPIADRDHPGVVFYHVLCATVEADAVLS
jgi:mannose/cellobiose epimerase-like protein (N-acyl-D-glucosamine 2-epimerase family)